MKIPTIDMTQTLEPKLTFADVEIEHFFVNGRHQLCCKSGELSYFKMTDCEGNTSTKIIRNVPLTQPITRIIGPYKWGF